MEDTQPQPPLCIESICIESKVSIPLGDRWQIRRRLEELDISCNCLPDGSFTVVVDTPLTAIQLWSVVRQLTLSRKILVDTLERCWS